MTLFTIILCVFLRGNDNAVGRDFLYLQGVILSLHIRLNLQVNLLKIGAYTIFFYVFNLLLYKFIQI